ncbi:hypothetical protein [Sulfuricurvum sp.]|uniref:CiaD-like domain-containing protein n=1 Tax=Sulfuricurvum sp. TaxID=2025608 RepID=UPI00198FE7C1|nr:hypothetical protein [Sulfuricurvum sp.]MBD3798327.1 hypothetical protein [Campylobacterota bacterium]MBD3805568.1 hypothetical protein [Sulfuricurvum sp.]
MELKDVILSTLAEIEELASAPEPTEKKEIKGEFCQIKESHTSSTVQAIETIHSVRDDEARMLEGIRERLLVLFEGFQSPNNVQIEAKVDLTLNFLEYLLATIDNRLDAIKES